MSVQSAPAPTEGVKLSSNPGTAPLDAILCTERLAQRPKRAPDYETENRALAALVQALADAPATILQKLGQD